MRTRTVSPTAYKLVRPARPVKGQCPIPPVFPPPMPVYVIEFVTSDARPQQRRFTLDDDRPLRPQVEHVLAEMERAGLVLRGGPADELAVRWGGQEVDAARTPAQLGVTPDRAVELRMQRRRVPLTVAPAPPPPEAPATRFVPRGVYAGAALGAAGAWTAWTVAGAVADGSADGAGLFGASTGLDGIAAVLFGLLVGALTGAGTARRADGSTAGGAGLGAGAGAVAAFVWTGIVALTVDRGRDGASHAAATPLAAILVRAVLWALLGAVVAAGVTLATARWTVPAGRFAAALRAAAWSALAGIVAGLLPALPGPVELWTALAASVAGAGVGAAAAWVALRRAVGVLTLEARGERGPGVLSLREWTLADGRTAAIPDATGAPASLVTVVGLAVTQADAPGAPGRPIRQEDRLTVGGMRYRFRRLAALAVLLAIAWSTVPPHSAAAQAPERATAQAPAQATAPSAGPIDKVALMRCVADRALPCIQVRVTLPPDAAVREALAAGADAGALDDAADTASTPARATGWSGRLGPYVLEPVQVRIARAGGPRRAVLTLIDVSGSMKGDGMQVARAAVRAFLRDLGVGAAPGAVQAALGAFASRGVVAGIRSVAFATPETVAGNVDLLPPAAGNTGLYSAVAAGAERVAEAARDVGPGTRAALVVITDGVNDVTDAAGRPRVDDDPNLLRGLDGRAAAAAIARRLGVDLYLVGVGQEPDMNELQALAGDRGRAFRTARDAVALRAALARVDAALAPTRDVLFAVPGAERGSLARPEWRLTVAEDAGPVRAEFAGMWPAPALGTPVFTGAAFRADGHGVGAPAWLRATTDESPAVERRVLVAAFVALLVAIAWGLPRALWQPEPWPAAAARAGVTSAAVSDAPVRQLSLRPAVAEPAAVAPTGAGLAPDVRDAPPRRPEDVTAQRVRRNGTRPASMGAAAAALPPAAPRRS